MWILLGYIHVMYLDIKVNAVITLPRRNKDGFPPGLPTADNFFNRYLAYVYICTKCNDKFKFSISPKSYQEKAFPFFYNSFSLRLTENLHE